jgi:hypothetical protein
MLARFSFFNFRHFSVIFAIDGSKQNQKIQKIDKIQADSGLKSWNILHLQKKQNKRDRTFYQILSFNFSLPNSS